MAVPPDQLAALLAHWRIPATATITRPGHGTNNHTSIVTLGGDRWVLRISQNLSVSQVAAEHRLLGRLQQAGIPFAVPEPVATGDDGTVVETPDGPATLCRWIAGQRPDLTAEPALTRFGRAIGQLGEAMWQVPPQDAPHDWRRHPLQVHPAVPDVAELCADLRSAGADAALTDALAMAADEIAGWWSAGGLDLPVQVVHGDLAPSNVLVDPATGQVTGLLDFEIAGTDFRIQDTVSALVQSGALGQPRWQELTAAMARGQAQVRRFDWAELEVVPNLVASRLTGSVLWRAGRWRRGQASLGEVLQRVSYLDEYRHWLKEVRAQLVAALDVR